MNIALILEMAAEAGPDRVALVCEGKRWTYKQLLLAAHGAASLFKGKGYEYVALLDETSEAAPIALFGAAIAGIPYVPLNYRLADTDLSGLLARIAPAFVIGDKYRVKQLCPDQNLECVGRADFVTKATAVFAAVENAAHEGEGIAVQIFTSGTTAAPKAALLRHANLMGYILGTVDFCSAKAVEAQLVCVPPYHIAGISALLSSIYAMRRIVILPAFDPDIWLDIVAAEHVSNVFLVPTMLSRIIDSLNAGKSADLMSLQAIAYGGGRMPIELILDALARFPHCRFTNAYGLTETSSTIALLGPDDHRLAQHSDDAAIQARLASVGKPLATVELEIRDDEGQPVATGESGEIYVRGEQVAGEYRERSAVDAQGWFPTRDAGWLDDNGYLFLSGRADDVIVRGGENISPGEIEDVLLSHPSIADVAAVGVTSKEWGETVGIAVVFKSHMAALDNDALCQLIKDRLRSSRVPEQIKILQALPYNEMGKLLRREVRNLLQS